MDPYEGFAQGLDSPSSKAVEITSDDATDLPSITRALYVGGSGDLVVILAKDSGPVTLKAVPDGTVLPLRIKRVLSGTTATHLVGLL